MYQPISANIPWEKPKTGSEMHREGSFKAVSASFFRRNMFIQYRAPWNVDSDCVNIIIVVVVVIINIIIYYYYFYIFNYCCCCCYIMKALYRPLQVFNCKNNSGPWNHPSSPLLSAQWVGWTLLARSFGLHLSASFLSFQWGLGFAKDRPASKPLWQDFLTWK